MAQSNKKSKKQAYGSDWEGLSRSRYSQQDHDEHNYNDDWDFSGDTRNEYRNERNQTQRRREQWDQNDLQDEYGSEYARQNRNEPLRNDYSGKQNKRTVTAEEDWKYGYRNKKRDSFGAQNQGNPQYDEFGSQTGNKRTQEGEHGRSRYGYGNDRNQPMEEFTSSRSNRNDEDWNRENSYYRSSRNNRREAEYGQEGFGDGPMKSDREKRRLNIYNQDYRDMARNERRNNDRRDEDNYASRHGRGPEYGISQNAVPGRNRSRRGGSDYNESSDSQYGTGSHYERREGHGGHGNIFGRGPSYRETEQGHGKGGAQFSGRSNAYDLNTGFDREEEELEEEYRPSYNQGSRNARSSRYSESTSNRNQSRNSRRSYENDDLSYDQDYDEREEYLDAFRPVRRNNSDRNNRH
jgi:hypothetical protein